jgi:arginyl-tRNA synthetase
LKRVFSKNPDGSVWIDLTDEGLDRKIVLRLMALRLHDPRYWYAIQRVKDMPGRDGIYGW